MISNPIYGKIKNVPNHQPEMDDEQGHPYDVGNLHDSFSKYRNIAFNWGIGGISDHTIFRIEEIATFAGLHLQFGCDPITVKEFAIVSCCIPIVSYDCTNPKP